MRQFIIMMTLCFLAPVYAEYPEVKKVKDAGGEVVYQYETGRSEVNLDCVSLKQITGKESPKALLIATRKCLDANRINDAVDLFLVAELYLAFDVLRTKDETAHSIFDIYVNGLAEYLMNNKNGEKFLQLLQEKTSNVQNLCALGKAVPLPTYFPDYMIVHGMVAVNYAMDPKNNPNPYADPLNKDLTPEELWNIILTEKMLCPSEELSSTSSQSSNELNCVDPLNLDGHSDPIKLMDNFNVCIYNGDMKGAWNLLDAINMVIFYDSKRVQNYDFYETMGMVMQEVRNILESHGKEQEFLDYALEYSQEDTCDFLKNLPIPKYKPIYALDYFPNSKLIELRSPQKVWNTIMQNELKCSPSDYE